MQPSPQDVPIWRIDEISKKGGKEVFDADCFLLISSRTYKLPPPLAWVRWSTLYTVWNPILMSDFGIFMNMQNSVFEA
jgi:hypothetical protein